MGLPSKPSVRAQYDYESKAMQAQPALTGERIGSVPAPLGRKRLR
jgi:hypothetical protein